MGVNPFLRLAHGVPGLQYHDTDISGKNRGAAEAYGKLYIFGISDKKSKFLIVKFSWHGSKSIFYLENRK